MSGQLNFDGRAQAITYVEKARMIVTRQRQLVRAIRERQGDSSSAEDLLIRYENALRIFEDALRQIEADVSQPAGSRW